MRKIEGKGIAIVLLLLMAVWIASPASALSLAGVAGTWGNLVGAGATGAFVTVGSENQVLWGNDAGFGKSGLGFTPNPALPISFPVGAEFQIGTLRHFNRPVFAPSASAVDLTVVLNFTVPLSSTFFTFTFAITETPNVPPASSCPFPSTVPCSDKIGFPGALPSQPFTVGGLQFTLQIVGFRTSPGGTLLTDFVSEELQTNSALLFGIITTIPVTFLLIDEDSIDNGNPPNFFSDVAVNDQIADIGLRAQLPFFAANVGGNITLHTGEVGDEGWFALKSTPASWAAAGPTNDSLRNYVLAGPGLGSEDAEGDREALLDKIPDVTPLRATGLKLLEGRTVCAVVYDSDISINYDPLEGSLKGDNLGIVAFEVIAVTDLTGFSSSSLPQVRVLILDADVVCEASLVLFSDAPEPISSSEPFDVSVKGEEEEEEEG